MRNILLSMVLALSALVAMPSNAYAFDDPYLEVNGPLPTADSPPAGQWKSMRPASHEATGEGAAEQCNRNRTAGLIALSEQQCAELGQMVDAGEGRIVEVPDGIRLNINNGRLNGVPYTTQLVEKQLGRIDRAELFFAGTDQWGNRYYAYFFRGEDTSCNNIAWVILPPEPELVEVVTYEAPPPPPRMVCRLVLVSRERDLPSTRFVPGFLLPSCCPTCVGPTYVGPLLLSQPSSSSTTWKRVCAPEGD